MRININIVLQNTSQFVEHYCRALSFCKLKHLMVTTVSSVWHDSKLSYLILGHQMNVSIHRSKFTYLPVFSVFPETGPGSK